jgi:hypothetical protein
MRRAELEAWVLEVLERVEQGKPVEDSRVELKREWPDPERAARRIAGHANAARGEQTKAGSASPALRARSSPTGGPEWSMASSRWRRRSRT